MRALIRREVALGVPADVAWRFVSDWPRQSEWVPHTRVENVDADERVHQVGGRIRAWTGMGPVGFWDTMTITSWRSYAEGGGRCEVLHTGKVVRGEAELEVVADGEGASRFIWSEMVVVPFGRAGALGFRAARPLAERMLDQTLAALKERLDASGR